MCSWGHSDNPCSTRPRRAGRLLQQGQKQLGQEEVAEVVDSDLIEKYCFAEFCCARDNQWLSFSITCISKPSLVRDSGQAITPALLIRMSIWRANKEKKKMIQEDFMMIALSSHVSEILTRKIDSIKLVKKVLLFMTFSFKQLLLLSSDNQELFWICFSAP